ncbi:MULTISPECIES: DUF6231 family protein [unclassified Moraxella]|uniref:DUF6231 family protein n=1 Tax=unclassified Moraxella TaxID=2685852 RepID=UPI003AF4C5DF
MTLNALSLSDVVLQSLVFLAKEQAETQSLVGMVIGEPPLLSATPVTTLSDIANVEWQRVSTTDFIELNFSQRFELAVLILTGDCQIDTQNIQRCRDLFAKYCLVLQPVPIDSSTNQPLDMFSFGFSRFHEQVIPLLDNNYHIWQFNLFDYKHLPDWFNSKFWANPENWNKFRW